MGSLQQDDVYACWVGRVYPIYTRPVAVIDGTTGAGGSNCGEAQSAQRRGDQETRSRGISRSRCRLIFVLLLDDS